METIGTKESTGGGGRPAARVAVLLGLILAAVVALRGHLPDPASAPRDPNEGESPASLAGMIALLGVSMVVMAFAAFSRRPPRPTLPAWEMTEYSGGAKGRLSLRVVLIGLAFVLFWVVLFVVLTRFRPEIDPGPQAPPTVAVQDAPQPAQPAPAPKPAKEHRGTFTVLAYSTGALLVMLTAASIVAAARNRTRRPPVVVNTVPEPAEAPGEQPLAVAAERGLAQVANTDLAPREAIIACYAAMEQALAEAPGAAPQVSDTPSEVLARAVGNRNVSAGSASTLVDLFAEARFSPHEMTEGHREVAEQALRQVLGELRSPV